VFHGALSAAAHARNVVVERSGLVAALLLVTLRAQRPKGLRSLLFEARGEALLVVPLQALAAHVAEGAAEVVLLQEFRLLLAREVDALAALEQAQQDLEGDAGQPLAAIWHLHLEARQPGLDGARVLRDRVHHNDAREPVAFATRVLQRAGGGLVLEQHARVPARLQKLRTGGVDVLLAHPGVPRNEISPPL